MSVKNLIIDGTNLEFRILHVVKGKDRSIPYYNHVYRILCKYRTLINEYRPENVYMAWDRRASSVKGFRRELMGADYKANRVMDEEFVEMFKDEPVLFEALEALGAIHIFPNSLEADDVCAWLSHTLQPGRGDYNMVVSADSDLLQLVTDNTTVYNYNIPICGTIFERAIGVSVENYVRYKAIMGDRSDTINGIPGYGPVKAKAAASDPTLARFTEDQRKLIQRNIEMMDLRYGYKHQPGEEQFYKEQLELNANRSGSIEKFEEICRKNNILAPLTEMHNWKPIVISRPERSLLNEFSK